MEQARPEERQHGPLASSLKDRSTRSVTAGVNAIRIWRKLRLR